MANAEHLGISGTCRCCLSRAIILNDIFELNSNCLDIAKAIQDVCGINIYSLESILPNKICDDCLECLKVCYNFRKITQQSDKTLQSILEGSIIIKDCVDSDHSEVSDSTVFVNTEEDSQNDQTNAETYHKTVSDVEIGSDLQCPYCFKNFVHLRNLRVHKKRHFSEGKYSCPYCPEKYHTNFDVRRHMTKTHSEGFSFKCDLCNKEFPSKPEWNRHIKSHDDAKCYACPVCGMQFKLKDNAQQHIRILHEKKKTYFCELCGKGFAFLCKLKQHAKSKCKPSIHISSLKEHVADWSSSTSEFV